MKAWRLCCRFSRAIGSLILALLLPCDDAIDASPIPSLTPGPVFLPPELRHVGKAGRPRLQHQHEGSACSSSRACWFFACDSRALFRRAFRCWKSGVSVSGSRVQLSEWSNNAPAFTTTACAIVKLNRAQGISEASFFVAFALDFYSRVEHSGCSAAVVHNCFCSTASGVLQPLVLLDCAT
jgi:hypothetical protein